MKSSIFFILLSVSLLTGCADGVSRRDGRYPANYINKSDDKNFKEQCENTRGIYQQTGCYCNNSNEFYNPFVYECN